MVFAVLIFMRSLHAAFLTVVLSTGAALADEPPQLTLRQIATGLTSPVSIAHTNDSRLFIVEQTGLIVIFDGTRVLDTPFLDIHSLVSCCGERGLLGLAFHPDYAANGRFYVYYTRTGGDIVLARYTVSAFDPNRADPASGAPLLVIPHQQFDNHNGGQLQFGPDGYLYIGVGDGGSGGDPSGNGQNTNVLLAKLLRIDVNGGQPYVIPPSNPFAGRSDARREIWAYGLRNPWRFSFDRQTGDLWIADVGQDKWEEIDLQPATSAGGENYGWSCVEATHSFNPAQCRSAGMTLPILEYGHDGGACSVTGGYRYRGSLYPRFHGMFLYADYCTGAISAATQKGDGSWASQKLFDAHFNISTFGEDAVGEIYVADYMGTIYQITDALPFPVKRRAARH
jgi:glucose/arabinose dehydrogenase